jgi:hypothetical protein
MAERAAEPEGRTGRTQSDDEGGQELQWFCRREIRRGFNEGREERTVEERSPVVAELFCLCDAREEGVALKRRSRVRTVVTPGEFVQSGGELL